MSEHDSGTGRNGNGGDPADRLAAHERLSTGALARWYRACATHPRRVFLSWLGIFVVLIALVATIGGSLKDEFDIPGSDTQKATDLIESEFASEQGGVLNLVFAAPPGSGSTRPSARKRSRTRSRSSRALSSSRPRTRRGSRASAIRSTPTRSRTTGGSPTRKPSSIGSSSRRIARPSSPFRMPSAKRSLRPASRSSTTATPSSRRSSREPRSCLACWWR